MTNLALSNESLRIEQAIDWMSRLTSGAVTAGDHLSFAEWRSEHPANEIAWQRLKAAVDYPFADLAERPSQKEARALTNALTQRSKTNGNRRRFLKNTIAFTAFAAIGITARQYFQEDCITQLAERRSYSLPDGSDLELNARSAVNVRYGEKGRLLELAKGELIVSVVKDPGRPFIVRSKHGEVRALGTKFMVRQDAHQTTVAVLEHSVLITSHDGTQKTLQQGQVAVLNRSKIRITNDSAEAVSAWKQGLIDVRNAPLGEVVESLRPYQGGWLRISDEAARLPVFGVFPLDRPHDALKSLHETMPIEVKTYGPWLTLIDLAGVN